MAINGGDIVTGNGTADSPFKWDLKLDGTAVANTHWSANGPVVNGNGTAANPYTTPFEIFTEPFTTIADPSTPHYSPADIDEIAGRVAEKYCTLIDNGMDEAAARELAIKDCGKKYWGKVKRLLGWERSFQDMAWEYFENSIKLDSNSTFSLTSRVTMTT